MPLRAASFKIQGMNRDLSESVFKAEFAYENMNMRIVATDNNTTLSLSNEKGNILAYNVSLYGIPLGYAVIDNILVIFTHNTDTTDPDRIYKFTLEDGKLTQGARDVWAGDLGFDSKYPIETIVSYEAKKIKKVYWVDGLNQMRFINVADNIRYFKASDFDFTPEIAGEEKVEISRIESSLGVFPSGCIQYFFTYYNKYGQESGIFYSSTLLYTSPSDRGGTAEQTSTCYFNIQLSGLDSNFDYVRVYAIHRTSLNTEVAAYLVGDYQIIVDDNQDGSVVLNDYGTSLSTIDSTELLFKSSEPIIAGTITQKDQRLFAGNVSLDTSYHLTDEQISEIKDLFEVNETYKEVPYVEPNGVYPYENNLKLGEDNIKSFKGGDWYRVAVQLQSKIGTWTEPIFLCDYKVKNYPHIDNSIIYAPVITVTLSGADKIPDGFTKMRALIASPLDGYKSIMCQGVLCPTMYHVGNRYNNSPYAVSSWFMRPIAKDSTYDDEGNIDELGDEDTALHFKHYDYVASNLHTNGEIQLSEIEDYPVIDSLADYKFLISFSRVNMVYKVKIDLIPPGGNSIDNYIRLVTINTKNYNRARQQLGKYIDENLIPDLRYWKSDMYSFYADPSAEYIDSLIIDDYKTTYYIDQNIVTFHSPDINDNTQNKFDGSSLKLRIIGVVPITAGYMSYYVQTTGSLWNPSRKGLLNINYDKNNLSDEFYGLISAPLWNDDSKTIEEQEGENKEQNRDQGYNFVIYPWHRNGSLNDDSNSSTSLDEDDDKSIAKTSVLDKKIFANLRFSYRPFYFNNEYFWSKDISVFNVFNSDEVTAVPININSERKIYFGNVDTILTPNTEYDDTKDGTNYKEIYEVKSNTRSGYLITYNPGLLVSSSEGITYSPLISKDNNGDNNFVVGKEPVSIKYKSTIHGVFRFDNDYILPSIKINGKTYNEKIEVDGFAIGSLAASQYAGIIRDTTTTLAEYNSKIVANWINYVGLIIAIVVQDKEGRDVYCLRRIVRDSNDFDQYVIEEYGEIGDIYYREYEIVTGQNEDGTEIKKTIKEFYEAVKSKENEDKEEVTDANGDELEGFVLKLITVPQSVINQDSIKSGDDISLGLDYNSGFLYMAELYREDSNNEIAKVIYGEATDEALRNNTWIVNSDAVAIEDENQIQMIGDTFFGRWDCMKTYPFTNEDQNQVIDITSFMVESAVNLDGRTDRNRGQKDNTVMSPTNFNLFNDVYNQENNYFTYNITDNTITQYDFPNTIIWSLTKTNGEVIDTWAAMLMTSYLDMDGDKGKVTSLNKFDNNIICFQENAVSQILYNETTQISSSEGVPIEIANSGAVSGKRYLSDSIGAYNKWGITEAPSGIYFIDDFARTLNIVTGKAQGLSTITTIQNLSDTAGFHSWFFNQLKVPTIWNPEDFGGMVTYYDAMNQDLMIITKDNCLSFSEKVGGFGSFYSYEDTPYFINIRNRLLTLHSNSANNYLIYFQNEGEYNNFFGNIKPYYTTVVVNSDGNESTFKTDKIFNNLEFRSNSWDENGNLLNWQTFDTLKVWNEYQEAEVPLYDRRGYPSTLKKKFRIWRTLIPRDQKALGKRNRIRNPWMYLSLIKSDPNNERTVLHDLTVYYFD